MSPRPTDPLRPVLDLNCDLGEGEPQTRAEAILGLVDSANIACGAHAGTDDSMRWCLAAARRLGVHPGAHPGFSNRHDFGRGSTAGLTVEGLVDLLEEQVGRIAHHAASLGVTLHHVKLHGSLYHAVESDPALAQEYLRWMSERWPGVRVFARAGGCVEHQNQGHGDPVEVWPEGFLDRGYRGDGTLVPRDEAGALLDEETVILTRLADLRQRGGLTSSTGRWLPMKPRTLCVHGDGPRVVEILKAVRRLMPATQR